MWTQTQGGVGHRRENKGAEVVRGWGAVATGILVDAGKWNGHRAPGDERRGLSTWVWKGGTGTGTGAQRRGGGGMTEGAL